jgi:thiol:disulfide interchange protein DsbC
MRILSTLAASCLALLLSLPALSQDLERVKADLRKKFPDAQIDTARKAGYGNLIEITGGGEIFYTDESTSFLLLGSLIDTKTRQNLTEARLRKLSAIKFEALPLESAIKIVRGNGKRKLAIFEDPNCGYCKRFERDIAQVTDLTVYVFLYPILSPDSTTKSKAIWCSADRGKAWMDYILRDVMPTGDATCETPLEKNLAFGREKRISGTPTLFFEDGERLPGAVPVAMLEKRLAEAAGAKKP